jgi:hypothetical protein
VRIVTLLALTGLVAGPVTASEVISFDEVPAQNNNFNTLSEEYAHLGVHFETTDDGSTWDGMSNADPGGWELEGTNGPTFVGFNGDSYRLIARFDAPVPAFGLDVAAASGADPGGSFAVQGYRAGALVETENVTLGALNEWMPVALSADVDEVVLIGDTRGFRPFGVDNMHWGLDAPGEPAQIDASIDVLPGSDENPLNPGSKGVVPVALLGSETLDVMNVDPTSLALGVGAAPAKAMSYADVNGDGRMDLMAHYEIPATGTAYGDTSICLTGTTMGGGAFAGCDSIRTVPGKGPRNERAGCSHPSDHSRRAPSTHMKSGREHGLDSRHRDDRAEDAHSARRDVARR